MRLRVFLFLAAVSTAWLNAEEPEPVLSLDDAIALALAHNRSLKVESYAPGIARANWLAAVGQFDPSLTFNRTTSDEFEPGTIGSPQLAQDQIKTQYYNLSVQGQAPWGLTYSVGANAYNQSDIYNSFAPDYSTFGGVQITQHLLSGFGFGVNLAPVRIARANRAMSEWDFQKTAMQTVANVAFAYSGLLEAHDQLRIAQKFLDLFNSTFVDNEKEYGIGYVSKSDVVQAQEQAATQVESVLIADRAVRDAENQLRLLIGQDTFPPDQPLYVLAPYGWTDDVAVNPEHDLQTALALRPDYRAQRLGVQINRFSDIAARNGLLPQMDFVGGYGYNGLSSDFSAARQMVADRLNPSYQAGLAVTIPFTFAQARGKARAARLQLRQSEENLRLTEGALSLATAAGQIETTRQRVVADRSAYDLADKAVDEEVKKLHAGKSGTFFVLNLQLKLAEAENALSYAVASERQAAVNYELQMGTILERHHIALAKP